MFHLISKAAASKTQHQCSEDKPPVVEIGTWHIDVRGYRPIQDVGYSASKYQAEGSLLTAVQKKNTFYFPLN